MKNIAVLFLLFVFAGAGAQTPRINVKVPDLYPEGVALNAKTNQFFLSSVRTGTIGVVNQAGNYTAFYQDSTLKSSYGMKADAAHNRLWVCTGDANYSRYKSPSTFKKIARLIAIDLTTGKKVQDIDLAKLYEGKHFLNDLTLDDKGNIYLTDSYSPVIYKVDAQGKSSIFAQSDLFKGEDVGLNGIVYDQKGFLLVDNSSDGAIYKVDINDPKKITAVKSKEFFPGADGLLLDEQGSLVLIQNQGVDKVFRLTSNDSWQSAEVKAATATEDRFQHPSTGVMQMGKLYAVNSKLDELADPNKRPSKEFSLQSVELKPVQ